MKATPRFPRFRDYGSFICHSAVVELFLDITGVHVMRDDDRVQGMVWL